MAFLLKTNGSVETVRPANGEAFSLQEMQALVGGFIEIVPMHTGGIMVIDEEGKLKSKPLNEQATERYKFGGHDSIVGDALIVSYVEAGEKTDAELAADQLTQPEHPAGALPQTELWRIIAQAMSEETDGGDA